VLSAGDVYDMKARRIEKLGTGATPPQRGSDRILASDRNDAREGGSAR
jgi:hypothetical protein